MVVVVRVASLPWLTPSAFAILFSEMMPRPITKDTVAMWMLLALSLMIMFGVGQALGAAIRGFPARLVWFFAAIFTAGLWTLAYMPRFAVLQEVFAWRAPASVGWIAWSLGIGAAFALTVRAALGNLKPVGPEDIILSTTLGPIVEELFFRGFLWAAFGNILEGHANSRTTATLVVLTSALVFTALHSNPSAVYVWLRFTAGVLHGFLRQSSKSTLAPAAAHWAFNVLLVV